MRAAKLYELYRAHASLEAIPPRRAPAREEVLRASLDEVWAETRALLASSATRREVAGAERDPRHKMALVFRWYLGLSSRWAIAGEPTRQVDYQVWCGPAMGAFNEWAKGIVPGRPGATAASAQIARNLLEGARWSRARSSCAPTGLPCRRRRSFRPGPLRCGPHSFVRPASVTCSWQPGAFPHPRA